MSPLPAEGRPALSEWKIGGFRPKAGLPPIGSGGGLAQGHPQGGQPIRGRQGIPVRKIVAPVGLLHERLHGFELANRRRAICRPNAYQGNRRCLEPALRQLKSHTSRGLASGCHLAKRNSCSRSNSSHGSSGPQSSRSPTSSARHPTTSTGPAWTSTSLLTPSAGRATSRLCRGGKSQTAWHLDFW